MNRHVTCALIVLAHLTVFPYSPGINNPNENVRIYMTRALVEHHDLAVNRVEAEWGWVNDKARAPVGPRVFSSKAPGVSLLGVPVLAAQTWLWHRLGWRSPSKQATTWALRFFVVMLPMCAFAFALRGYFERSARSDRLADLLLLGVTLGSLLYPYSIHFVGHALAAAASFGAFMVLAPAGSFVPRRTAALVAGGLAGLGVLFEYQNILIALALGIYLIVKSPRLVPLFVLGALPSAFVLGVFHTLCFGKPWAFPYGHLDSVEFQVGHHTGGFYGLGAPHGEALRGVLFAPGFGFFACSPFLVLGAIALGYLLTKRPRGETVVLGAVSVAMMLFIAGMPNWRGGWSVGPRYGAAVVPYLAMPLAMAWARRRSGVRPQAPGAAAAVEQPVPWGLLALLAALVTVGVFLNSASAVVYPQYPPHLRNPVFQLELRLLADGYAPYSLGWLLGLPGVLSIVPTVVVIVAAVGWTLARVAGLGPTPGSRRGVVIASVAGAVVILIVASLYPRLDNAGERAAVDLVKRSWTPLPAPPLIRPAAPPPVRPPAPIRPPAPRADAGPQSGGPGGVKVGHP